jgi:hypothetical protein
MVTCKQWKREGGEFNGGCRRKTTEEKTKEDKPVDMAAPFRLGYLSFERSGRWLGHVFNRLPVEVKFSHMDMDLS